MLLQPWGENPYNSLSPWISPVSGTSCMQLASWVVCVSLLHLTGVCQIKERSHTPSALVTSPVTLTEKLTRGEVMEEEFLFFSIKFEVGSPAGGEDTLEHPAGIHHLLTFLPLWGKRGYQESHYINIKTWLSEPTFSHQISPPKFPPAPQTAPLAENQAFRFHIQSGTTSRCQQRTHLFFPFLCPLVSPLCMHPGLLANHLCVVEKPWPSCSMDCKGASNNSMVLFRAHQ